MYTNLNRQIALAGRASARPLRRHCVVLAALLFTVAASSSHALAAAKAALTTSAPGSFALVPILPSLTVAWGGSAADAIIETGVNGVSGVTLTDSITPSGSGVICSPMLPTLNPTISAIVCTAVTGATPGTYTISVTGTGPITSSGTPTASLSIPLTVTEHPIGATVSVDRETTGPAISDTLLGMNAAPWYDVVSNGPTMVRSFKDAGIKAVRWPGGSWSDVYHWATNSNCLVAEWGTPVANDTFSNFVKDIVTPARLDVALTANYGTNETCDGGGDPTEAAAWAAEALALGARVSHFTVGNEVYGTWETDLHPVAHDPATYASAVTTGYYPDIKAVSPNTLVGVVVEPDYAPWDSVVLTNAKYDFVEFHLYPEAPGSENDILLTQLGALDVSLYIDAIKSELAAAGKPETPIYVGEVEGPYSDPGKQSWSITQGLYAGQVLGEMMNDGVSRLTWFMGFGACNGQNGNDSSSLYGWQNFGAYNVFSDGPDDPTCPAGSIAPDWGTAGTMSPTARAFQLFSRVAVNGEHVLTSTVTGDTTDVRAYSATNRDGTALVLFNLNETSSEPVKIELGGKRCSRSVTVNTYDKALYDQTSASTPVWAEPAATDLGAQRLPLTLHLAPWSMNVVIIR